MDTQANHHILFFDGDCGICQWSIKFVIKRDKNRVFSFAPLQGEQAQLIPDQYRKIDSLIIQTPDGYFQKFEGVRYILKLLPGFPWPFLALLANLCPKFIGNFCYDRVAQIRHHFRRENCELLQQEDRKRFLP